MARPGALLNVLVFILAVVVMASKPILLFMSGGSSGASRPLSAPQFQLLVEASKIAICVVCLGTRVAFGVDAIWWQGWRHSLAFATPALLYLAMNLSVLFVARMLSPPVFQLLANTKILCTAIAMKVFLARRISPGQWLALVLLTVGVILGQWRGDLIDGFFDAPFIAFVLCMVNGCLSAVAGVLIERVMKAPSSLGLTIFATSLHTSSHTLIFTSIGLYAGTEAGLLDGVFAAAPFRLPTLMDVFAISNDAVNGILMVFLMRRLDSIMKNFAFGISIFVTAGFSAMTLGFEPSPQFFLGAALSVVSGFLYAKCSLDSNCSGSSIGKKMVTKQS